MAYHFGVRCEQVRLPKYLNVFAPSFKEIVVNADNSVEEKLIPSNKPLPAPETVDLETMIKAGIPLQRVNSKVIQSDFSDFLSAASDSEEFTEIAEEDLNNNNTQNTQTNEV